MAQDNINSVNSNYRKMCPCSNCMGKKPRHDPKVKHVWSKAQCPYCMSWFGSQGGRNNHITRKHPGIEPGALSQLVLEGLIEVEEESD